jgi:hypothetical protein
MEAAAVDTRVEAVGILAAVVLIFRHLTVAEALLTSPLVPHLMLEAVAALISRRACHTGRLMPGRLSMLRFMVRLRFTVRPVWQRTTL